MSRQPPALLAKAALRRLALDKLEPTPENYARAYAQEAGEAVPGSDALPERAQPPLNRLLALGVFDPAQRQQLAQMLRDARWDEAGRLLESLHQSQGPQAQAENLAQAVERLMRGLERGGRQWTLARKKDGVQRVLASNRSDPLRLAQRLRQLALSWDSDALDAQPVVEADEPDGDDDDVGGTPSQFFTDEENASPAPARASEAAGSAAVSAAAWPAISASLHGTVQQALNADEQRALELMAELQAVHLQAQQMGASEARAQAIEALCTRARRLLDHKAHAFGEMGRLCRELTESLADLAEDDSWARGQCQAMTQTLDQGLNARSVRAVSELLAGTRERQQGLREERARARDALKTLINRMLQELGELGQHTDRFQSSVGRYAEVIERADSLESLTGVVREMVEESRTVQALVQQTQARLHSEHEKADQLTRRVEQLEGELRRLSDEVHTDQLTQVANRRGLLQAFEIEQGKLEREPSSLALALLDIDNFKKLNDTLGHAAGDEALKSLAARVSGLLRPGDKVGRWGGEEFVLILPAAPLDEARSILTRLQRSLSASLFMHEGQDVFVTFSAGITLYRPGETLDTALNRADEALYEAKRTGKNRACVAE